MPFFTGKIILVIFSESDSIKAIVIGFQWVIIEYLLYTIYSITAVLETGLE